MDLSGCFAQGQAYVALSRARSANGLKVWGVGCGVWGVGASGEVGGGTRCSAPWRLSLSQATQEMLSHLSSRLPPLLTCLGFEVQARLTSGFGARLPPLLAFERLK